MAKLSVEQALTKAKAHTKRGELAEARALYATILKSFPNNKRAQKAQAILSKTRQLGAKQLPPKEIRNELVKLYEQGEFLALVEQAQTLTKLYPEAPIIWFLLGLANKGLGMVEGASLAFQKFTELDPKNSEGFNNLGTALEDQGRFEEAIVSYKKALSITSDYAEAHYNMGNALQQLRKLDEAVEAYEKALALKPDFKDARALKLAVLKQICDWNAIQEIKLIPELGTSDKFVLPFSLLPLEDAPDRHRIRSEVYAKVNYPQKPMPLPAVPSKKPKRIRIGYFSADFKNHPTSYLVAKVFEQHSRDKFEIFGYSLHGNEQSEMRWRMVKSFDSFLDVQSMSDKDVALRARQDEIDIAVDLNGYTKFARSGIFAYRAAPIQINYFVYPGTMGADFIDYMVADPIVVSANQRSAYSEKIIYLPNTYQPNDNTRAISQKNTTKAEMGLPDDGFVFCCFNSNYKISSTEFDIWMRLLDKVYNSVLWLLKTNQSAEQNLRHEAEKRGIQANRLVFAERLSQSEHLARHRHADLFIDTFNYNAHTTASDALWAGLPMVTKLGRGFAARVAGSLLSAVGLPELITESEQDYEALILKLATNPDKLAKIKKKLAINRLSKPLFDTEQYTKHLEDGYQQAYHNYFDGKAPQTIIVEK